MRLPLLLLHNVEYDEFNNWALLLPPVRSTIEFATFAAACMLCRPQHQLNSCNPVILKLARAKTQSSTHLSHRQRARLCASGSMAGVLALRLTFLPRKAMPPRKRDEAGPIRSRVGGLQLLHYLVLESLYKFSTLERVRGVEHSGEESSGHYSDGSSSSSSVNDVDCSGCGGSSSSDGRMPAKRSKK